MTIKLESCMKEEDGPCARDFCSLHLFSVPRIGLREAGTEGAPCGIKSILWIIKKKRKSTEILNRREGGC